MGRWRRRADPAAPAPAAQPRPEGAARAQPGRPARPQTRGRFERVLFAFMGPPQVGDVNAPVRETAPRPVQVCGTCGQPRDEHEVVLSPSLTYTVCPGRPGT